MRLTKSAGEARGKRPTVPWDNIPTTQSPENQPIEPGFIPGWPVPPERQLGCNLQPTGAKTEFHL